MDVWTDIFQKKNDWLNLILELLFPRLSYRSHTYQLFMQYDYGWSKFTIGSSVSENRETCEFNHGCVVKPTSVTQHSNCVEHCG